MFLAASHAACPRTPHFHSPPPCNGSHSSPGDRVELCCILLTENPENPGAKMDTLQLHFVLSGVFLDDLGHEGILAALIASASNS